MVEWGMTQIIRSNTRITNTSSTLIDHLYTNVANSTCEIISLAISDHEGVLYNLDTTYNRPAIEDIIEIPGSIDWNAVQKILSNQLTNFVIDLYDNNYNYRKLVEMVDKAVEESRKPTVRIKRKMYNPYFNNEVLEARRLKINTYNEFLAAKRLNRPNDENVNRLWTEYKVARNRFVAVLRKNKNAYILGKLDECGKDGRKLWRLLKEIMNNNTNNGMKRLMMNDEIIDDEKVAAEELNKFYINSIENIRNGIPNVQYQNNVVRLNNEIREIQIPQDEEIKFIAQKLKGKDSIQPSALVMKKCWNVIGDLVCHVVKTSIQTCTIPVMLKTSRITPVPKVSNSCNINDLRPINVLPSMDKIIEEIIRENILNYVHANSILSNSQFGFREKHSTETAINVVLEDWILAMENKKKVLAVFLDLKRAFETIDRQILLEKLDMLGIRLPILADYLIERKQKVKFGREESNEIGVKYGLPQGSKLSPLCFILFINELPGIVTHCKIKLFADDALVYIETEDTADGVSKLNSDLQIIENWLNMNKLCLNTTKTKWMLLTKSDDSVEDDVVMGGTVLGRVTEIKYLGVLIDSKLTFKSHFQTIITKVTKNVAILRKLKYCLNMKTKKVLFDTLVKPHLQYCSTIWNFASEESLQTMQVVINNALRCILNVPYDTHIVDMLKLLNMLKLKDQVYVDTMTFLYKLHHGLLPKHIHNLVVRSNIHQHQTRSSGNFYLNHRQTSLAHNSVFYGGVSKYNQLEKVIKDSITVKEFRRKVKEKLLNGY